MSEHPKVELALVMPVFNEEASVRKVVRQWFEEISNWTESFVFLALDDASTARTPASTFSASINPKVSANGV